MWIGISPYPILFYGYIYFRSVNPHSASAYSKGIDRLLTPFYYFILSTKRIVLFCCYCMYGTFTNSKFFCSLPYSGIMFDDIFGNFHCSFFYITLQGFSPAIFVFTLYAGKRFCILNLFRIPNYESCTKSLAKSFPIFCQSI